MTADDLASVARLLTLQPALDPSTLDPGIRDVVLWLRWHGFNTTDSGDGVTKFPDGVPVDMDVLPWPHVFMVVEPAERLTDEALRLHALLKAHSLLAGEMNITATFDPTDGVAGLMLVGVTSAKLLASPIWAGFTTEDFGKAMVEQEAMGAARV
jgi:hypothetical protein